MEAAAMIFFRQSSPFIFNADLFSPGAGWVWETWLAHRVIFQYQMCIQVWLNRKTKTILKLKSLMLFLLLEVVWALVMLVSWLSGFDIQIQWHFFFFFQVVFFFFLLFSNWSWHSFLVSTSGQGLVVGQL